MSWRQKPIKDWVLNTFGKRAWNPKERAARLVEEAIELGQVCGLDEEEAKRILWRVYRRKPGELTQEIGGVMITLEALAEYHGASADLCADLELERIQMLPPKYFIDKYADKASAGIVFFKENHL